MSIQKLESELNLSLNLSPAERMMCSVLCSGYDPETDIWKLILLYQGSLEEVSREVPFSYVPLLGKFAIINIASRDINNLLTYPQILYLELSRPLYLEVTRGLAASCLNAAPGISVPSGSLTGRGTAVGIIDSGLDFRHPDFRHPDGTTRILTYWDQSLPYDGNNRYGLGRIFSEEDLNQIILSETGEVTEIEPSENSSQSVAPGRDLSGHGTHVTGICAGNGLASGGRNRGVAPEASLIIVRLKNEGRSVYSDYASLMMAADYTVRFASEKNIPLSVNISYGSNDGPHDGSSLIEQFFQKCIFYGRNTITVATGNEGLTRRHAGAVISGTGYSFPFSIADGEQNLYLQLWKNPADIYDYQLTSPDRQSVYISGSPGIYRYRLGENQVFVSVSESTPYQPKQEVFISFAVPSDSSADTSLDDSPDTPDQEARLAPGIWQFSVLPETIVNGRVNLWLPSREATNRSTGFLDPDTELTFTVPSTAGNVISVSGYDSGTDVFASFSGQGFSNDQETKPDLCAPAVNILSAAPGGGYSIRTGTSMAAPFVSGSCALLMQWGIINGNDPFMFGEKVKAALWKGSKALPAFRDYPNPQVGWGKLCFTVPGTSGRS